MKKFFIGISAAMICAGLVLAGASHPDQTVQMLACTAGVLILASGVLILIIVNS